MVLVWHCFRGKNDMFALSALRDRFAVSHAANSFQSVSRRVVFARILVIFGPVTPFSGSTFVKIANGNLNILAPLPTVVELEGFGWSRHRRRRHKWQWSRSYPWWKFGR